MPNDNRSAFGRAFTEADGEALRELLAENLVFRSPAATKPYHGVETVLPLLITVREVLEDLTYVDEIREGDREVLRFSARVGDRTLDGVDLIEYDESGRIIELAVMIRPLPSLAKLAETVGDRLQKAAQ